MRKRIEQCDKRRVTIDALMILYLVVFIIGLILIGAFIYAFVHSALTSEENINLRFSMLQMIIKHII